MSSHSFPTRRSSDPVLDLANRAVYLWQPTAHVLYRLDIDRGRTDRVEVDPDSTIGGEGGTDVGGVTSKKQPQWATLASGNPGSDADGNPATWQASLTILDAADGRPALQLGSLGTNYQVLQLPR